MKRFIVFLAVLLFALLPLTPPALTARAEGMDAPEERYAVAAREDVWFYAAENEESGLFLIPYTYYVRIIREGTMFTAVQYLDDVSPYRAVTGFCKTEQLTFVDFVPVRPYLRREITVAYTIAGENPLGSAFNKIERRFVYYGTSYAGTARYFYVYADGIFDYVPATQDILFERNTDYLEQTSATPDPPPSETEEPSPVPTPVQIVAICAAALAVLAVIVFILRGKRPRPVSSEEF